MKQNSKVALKQNADKHDGSFGNKHETIDERLVKSAAVFLLKMSDAAETIVDGKISR